MILTFPLDVGLTLPIFHNGSPDAPRGLPQENLYQILVRDGRALWVLTGRASGLRNSIKPKNNFSFSEIGSTEGTARALPVYKETEM